MVSMARSPVAALVVTALLAAGCDGGRIDPPHVSLPADPPGPASIEQVEAAVARGLDYLARTQSAGGTWTGDVGHKRMDDYEVYVTSRTQESRGAGHVGVSALAGLAFLASGEMPDRGPHAGVLRKTIDYLVRCTDGYSFITDSSTNMYSHAFAVLFLSQVHGMTARKAEVVADVLRRSTRFIAQSQNEYGAWRYAPFTNEADLSVTVCQVQALRAARNAGIEVSVATIDRVVQYVRDSRIASGPWAGAFYYKIYGRAARTKTSFAVNAAAVTSLHSAGLYDPRLYGRALELIARGYDEVSREDPFHFYYWYGNYYAAQALRMEGGPAWEQYWAKVSRDLVSRQDADGSWRNSVGPGANFSTAMACLILRVPLGYLPIFRN